MLSIMSANSHIPFKLICSYMLYLCLFGAWILVRNTSQKAGFELHKIPRNRSQQTGSIQATALTFFDVANSIHDNVKYEQSGNKLHRTEENRLSHTAQKWICDLNAPQMGQLSRSGWLWKPLNTTR